MSSKQLTMNKRQISKDKRLNVDIKKLTEKLIDLSKTLQMMILEQGHLKWNLSTLK